MVILAPLIRQHTITNLREFGMLCNNITEFGVAKDHLSTQGESDLSPPLMK